MMETELRQIVISRKEKYMKTESNITKLESDVDDLTKRIQHINLSLEKASITLKQVKKTFVVTTEKNRLMIRMMPNYKGRVGKRKSYGSGCCRPRSVGNRTCQKSIRKGINGGKFLFR